MGSDDELAYPEDGEAPVRTIWIAPFALSKYCVSNQEFAYFVEATGYITDAERYGTSFVFAGLLPDDFPPTRGVAAAPWWREVPRADWRHPEGASSTTCDRQDHPVVHVSYRDVLAYCSWASCRLPTEAEWEFAARGGLEQMPFPWGADREPGGHHRMNVWQGSFPDHNTGDDGYLGTAPVQSFEPNGFGLFNMTGNVWEWVGDWWTTAWSTEQLTNPSGPSSGDRRVLRGGSYLCHESYCRRYRVSARMGSTPESTSANVGFRTAIDLPKP